MLIVPIIIAIITAIAVYFRFGINAEALGWALIPMGLCYLGVAIIDILHIL